MYRYTCVGTISDVSCIREKQMSAKENICGHRCKRANIAAKYEIFVTVTLHLTAFLKTK